MLVFGVERANAMYNAITTSTSGIMFCIMGQMWHP